MAETTTTSNMNLVLPTPGQRLGPTWASDLNTALTTIDSHNHSTGQGAQIGIDGITIDGNFNFNKSLTPYPAINMKHLTFIRQTAAPGLNNGLYSYGVSTGTDGDLWFRNNNGVNIQITAGTAVNVPAGTNAANVLRKGDISTFSGTGAISTPKLMMTSGTTAQDGVVYNISPGTSYYINLPLGGSTGSEAGRLFVIKDVSGTASSNNIFVGVQGYNFSTASGGTQTIEGGLKYVTMNSNYAAVYFWYDGASIWSRI
jgi:hypothetical protein